MKPLVLIYWARLVLGIVAAIISALLASMQSASSLNTFLNGIMIALLVYIISYYLIKANFYNKVEKQSKIMTMGIGIYFIGWAVFFILSYTIINTLS